VTTAPLRILVVDDCADTARMMTVLLRLGGHAVKTAGDGPDALRAAQDHRPDVVLLDLGLPGMSGHEVARSLRQTAGLERTAIAALSGFAAAPGGDAEAATFDAHFEKPVDVAKLNGFLARLADRHPPDPAPR
jgi:CheY-like chemotaxis protein